MAIRVPKDLTLEEIETILFGPDKEKLRKRWKELMAERIANFIGDATPEEVKEIFEIIAEKRQKWEK